MHYPEGREMRSHRPMKAKLTLLLCANVNGDLKIKALLVYHSETPGEFRRHKEIKITS